jgi:arginine decarboxylase
MVPGQVISPEIITFMRKLDVKEIHGYHAAAGLKILKAQKIGGNAKQKAGRSQRTVADKKA